MSENGGLCHGEQKANSHNSGKNGLKMFVVVVVVVVGISHINFKSLRPMEVELCQKSTCVIKIDIRYILLTKNTPVTIV